MYKTFLFILFILNPLHTLALETTPLSEFPGCPENSICSKEQGHKYIEYKKILNQSYKLKNPALVNSFIKEKGAPLTGWIKSTPNKLNDASKLPNFLMSVYDSPCSAHRPPVKTQKSYKKIETNVENENLNLEAVFTSEIFLTKKIPSEFIPHYVFLLNKGNITKYISPLKNIPFLIKNKSLLFLMEYDGIYFHYNLSMNNDLSIDFNKYKTPEIMDTSCSKDLINAFKSTNESSLYEFYNCKSIWDESERNYKEILFGISC